VDAEDTTSSMNQIKSELFDLVSDFKEKFRPNAELKKKFDALVKEMVVGSKPNASQGSFSALRYVTELIRQFLSLARE